MMTSIYIDENVETGLLELKYFKKVLRTFKPEEYNKAVAIANKLKKELEDE